MHMVRQLLDWLFLQCGTVVDIDIPKGHLAAAEKGHRPCNSFGF